MWKLDVLKIHTIRKLDPQMVSIDVLDGSTKACCLQFLQASGPRKLTL